MGGWAQGSRLVLDLDWYLYRRAKRGAHNWSAKRGVRTLTHPALLS